MREECRSPHLLHSRHAGQPSVLGAVPLCACAKSQGPVQLFATPWTVAHQAPLSMGFSMQEYWSGLLWPLPGDLPNPGIKPMSLKSPALAGGLFTVPLW